jgi:hypothetical protein
MKKNKIYPEEELTKILSEELSKEIDKQIMESLNPYIRQSKIDKILEKIDKKNKKEKD